MEELILKQNKNYKVAEGDTSEDLAAKLGITSEDVEAAKQAVSEDGEFGVKAMSGQIGQFRNRGFRRRQVEAVGINSCY